MIIEDGKGSGNFAEVSSKNRLETESTSFAAQSKVSIEDGEAYQAYGEINITNSDVPVLYLENTSSDKYLVITYIRMMSIGAAASNAGAYFSVKLGSEYSSGGGTVTPVNMNQESGNIAAANCYDGTSSLSLTGGSVIDKNYEANSMQTYNKEGSVVLGKGDSISIWHLGSTAAGTAFARISFYYRGVNI